MPNALVSIVNGIPTTTSQKVAETFGKRHDSVVRGIRDLMDKCPKEFTAHNFVVSEYTDNTGRKLPMYLLTRDGLTLLVMGYTGKEAMRFKLAYIEAFNAMEAQLKAQPQQEFSTVEDRRTLNALVRAWVAASGLSFPDCWSQLHEAFKICDVTEMYLAEVPEAEAWVQARIDACRRPVLDFVPPSKMTRYDTAFSSRDWWQELEAAHKTLEELSGVISYRATTGYLMKHEFLGETVNAQVSLALGSLMMARCALRDALRLRCKVNLSR